MIVALTGVIIGYFYQGNSVTLPPVNIDRPCSCHCACTSPPSHSELRWDIILISGIVAVVLLLGLGFYLRGFLKSLGEPEFSFGIKGKAGKGVLQVRRGLQILDG